LTPLNKNEFEELKFLIIETYLNNFEMKNYIIHDKFTIKSKALIEVKVYCIKITQVLATIAQLTYMLLVNDVILRFLTLVKKIIQEFIRIMYTSLLIYAKLDSLNYCRIDHIVVTREHRTQE